PRGRAHSPCSQPLFPRQPRRERAIQITGRARARVPCRARCRRPARSRELLRLRGFRLPQPPSHGDCRPARGASVSRVLERMVRVAAIVYVAAETLPGFTCPLTLWEDVLRSTGREERSFIGRWLAWLLYYNLPGWVFAIAYCAFALAVVWAWRAIPPRGRSTG